MRVLIALFFSGSAALAEGPPLDYFTGTYERIGRNASVPPEPYYDVVRIQPAGKGIALSECNNPVGEPIPPLVLEFDSSGDGDLDNLLVGKEGPFQVWCLYHNNGDNYPLLTCGSDGGARFTLWPEPDLPCPN